MIEQRAKGYWLVSIDERGWEFIETSHPSVEDAMAEAQDQFGVAEDAWVSVNGKDS